MKMKFSIQSPQNMIRLLSTIIFEKSEYFEEYGYLWHTVFNADEKFGDNLFACFLTELFPKGTNLGETEIKKVMVYAIQYLKKDSKCQEIQVKYLKKKYNSWVYSMWNKKLMPCEFARHAGP